MNCVRSKVILVTLLLLAACVPAPAVTGIPPSASITVTPASTQISSPNAGATATPMPVCPPQPVLPLSQSQLALYLPETAQPVQFSLLEFSLTTTLQVKNPFDAAEIDLVVHYTKPDGKTITIPAFWYQAYDTTGSVACGEPGWKARLTPIQAGAWTAQAEVLNENVKSEVVSFQVAPATGNSKGFVRIHPSNPHYLAFDSGETFFPIGINMGWGSSNPLADYRRWMDKLHDNHASIIRVWMASWSFGIEWNDTSLGDYTKRLRQAWLLDQVFDMAGERGIYIELVLLNHGAFSETVNPEWEANPYNIKNGGMCKTPECFASDLQARQYFQRRLRYIAARWGYSPNLLAWEWWNEEDWTPIANDALLAWVKEMTATLRQYDPYRHLVSTSFAVKNSKEVLNLPEIDFTQVHLYDFQDPSLTFPGLYRDMADLAPGKPVLFAEFGFSAAGEDAKSYDKEGVHLHNGLWAATFSGFASPAMYWWWDSYVEPFDLWHHYESLYLFLVGEDLATLQPGEVKLPSRQASAMVLQNTTHALVWVKNSLYQADAMPGMYDKPIQGLNLTLKGLQDGSYRVRWYDPTKSGQWLGESTAEVKNGSIILTVPDFNRDLAAKIIIIK